MQGTLQSLLVRRAPNGMSFSDLAATDQLSSARWRILDRRAERTLEADSSNVRPEVRGAPISIGSIRVSMSWAAEAWTRTSLIQLTSLRIVTGPPPPRARCPEPWLNAARPRAV
jgi:hypothetical protein